MVDHTKIAPMNNTSNDPQMGELTATTPVKGYQQQPRANIDQVNINKEMEEMVLQRLDELALNANVNPRWLAIGRTAIEQGFMAANRAIMNPKRLNELTNAAGK